ncbi:MAG: glycosyltransferase [bacterium]
MSDLNPKVSVITASYNYADLISQTIESVINQTYTNWELIVIDDGSTDNSREIIQKYCDKNNKIQMITHKDCVNKGLCETVKLGCKIAQGEYIAFLESDDIWDEKYLEKKIEVIEKYPDIPFIFSNVELFGDKETQKRLDEYLKFQKLFLKNQTYPTNLFNYFLFINLIPTFSCVMVKKNLLSNLDFNAPFPPHLDWFLWMQIAYDNELYYLDLPLTKWRIHQKSFIGRTQKIKKNNNKIIFSTIKALISKSNQHFLIKKFLINYYSAIMILLKMNKSSIKKILRMIIRLG